MKKLFTLKNCLIILLLLSIAIFFAVSNVQEFDNIQTYNSFLEFESNFVDSYQRAINSTISIIVTNFIISGFIVAFIVLFCIASAKQLSNIKFAFITLLFACFFVYMLQIILPWFITISGNGEIIASYLPKSITALIALLISIPCYVYFLMKEIKQRKAVTTEPVEQIDAVQE